MEKNFIIEENVTITYFYKVPARTKEEAEKKFYDGAEDVQYDFVDSVAGDNAIIETFEEEDWIEMGGRERK